MSEEVNNLVELRKYLLGLLDEAQSEEIEKLLVSDDECFQKLQLAETEIIQDLVDEKLSLQEKTAFDQNFILTEERREQIKFSRALRRLVDENSKPQTEKKPSFFDLLKSFILSPIPAFGLILAALGISIFVWWSYSRQSEIIVALNKAQKNERSTEARISDLDYAPKIEGTRGGKNEENLELVSAKARASEAVLKNPTAENYHELGRVFLAEKNFDESIKQFEKAIKLNPNIAKLNNDLGVALMEKGKQKDEGSLELFAKANESISKAIEADKNLKEAYFNQALTIELLNLPNQAKEAWETYLKLDPTSKWADEAREHLQKLEEKKTKNLTSEELEQEFTELYRQKNDEIAFQLVGQTRELINEKYLPQKLVISFLNTNDVEKLESLRFLGEIEKKRINDNYAADLFNYYKNTKSENYPTLIKAQNYVIEGYQFCLKDDFSSALIKFNAAKKLFLEVNNSLEANTITSHFIAYCLYNSDKKKEALEIFSEVDKFCQTKNYKWIYLLNFYWYIGWNYGSGDYSSINKVKIDYEKGLEMAKEINDSFMTQKYLTSLAYRCFLIKQPKEMLNYLQKAFEVSQTPQTSLRQKFRNYSDAVEMLSSTEFDSFSKLLVAEEIKVAEESKDAAFIAYSLLDAGIVFRQKNDSEQSKKFFLEAEKGVLNISEESEKKELLAQIYLNWGHLERKRKNYDLSAQFYDKSLTISQSLETPILEYETKKSRLLSYQSLGKDEEVGQQLGGVIELAEKYREKILNEQERHSFFNNEQTVYDIATEHYLKLEQPDKAFDFTELSSSRSLLNWLKRGVKASDSERKLEDLFPESEKPLSINKLKEKIPGDVQIVEYTILEDKVLIWVITKERFSVVSSEINSELLKEKVKAYFSLISSKEEDPNGEIEKLSKELYQYLIEPISDKLDKKKELCFIPSKILFQLPFSTLTSPNGKYLLSEFSIFSAPSLNVFLLSTETAKTRESANSETIFSIGNPRFNFEDFPDLENLPLSAEEAKTIGRYYKDSKFVTQEEATKTDFQNNYQKYDIIHFAGHYVVKEGAPLASSLIFADKGKEKEENVLTNSELLLNKPTKAKVVILSACQTSVEGYFNGEGLVGLSRTFLSLGVPLVVASQWKVDSTATKDLMVKFHFYRTQNKLSTTQALRQAQLDILESNKNLQLPYYWAAFSVIGGYAKF